MQDEESKISRTHAVIKISEEKIIIVPKGPNGTWLNDEELDLDEEFPLNVNDIIKIKDYTLKLIENIPEN